MSMCKSSMTMGTLAVKGIDWMKVPDKELATDLDDMDLVGNAKAPEKHRRLCAACDTEIQRAEEVHQEAEEREWKHQAEEVEKHQKEEEVRQREEAEKEKKRKAEERKQGKWELGKCVHMYQMHEAGAYMHHTNWGQEVFGMWVMCEGQGMMEHKKQVKKVADNNDDDEIVILSGQKTKWQGGSKMLEEISNQWWGELI
ncbi:hypothetical protein ID866_12301 [Astraeus odoratus]|nr:hypothetical protein ID866_12301 [Astraeus odoratus]